jgi:hypothetical protein
MSERKLSVLESRKRLLVAESELNRALLRRDVQALKAGLLEAAEPLRRLGSLASSAALLLTLFKVFRGHRSEQAGNGAPGSWFTGDLLQMGLAFWEGMRGKKPAPVEAVREDSYEAAGD